MSPAMGHSAANFNRSAALAIALRRMDWSGKRESNPRPSAWENESARLSSHLGIHKPWQVLGFSIQRIAFSIFWNTVLQPVCCTRAARFAHGPRGRQATRRLDGDRVQALHDAPTDLRARAQRDSDSSGGRRAVRRASEGIDN